VLTRCRRPRGAARVEVGDARREELTDQVVGDLLILRAPSITSYPAACASARRAAKNDTGNRTEQWFLNTCTIHTIVPRVYAGTLCFSSSTIPVSSAASRLSSRSLSTWGRSTSPRRA
jgi:hypothetical protein